MKIVSNKILLVIFPAIIALAGCDEIAQPIKSTQVNSVLPTSKPTFVDSSAVSGPNSYKNYKLLLEGLGGHFCINCATASLLGDSLVNPLKNTTTASNIVYIDENSGFESPPYAIYAAQQGGAPSGIKPYAWAVDYQSVAGNTWNPSIFNPIGYPQGSINRRNLLANMLPDTRWDDTISALLTPVPAAQVTLNIHDSVWIGVTGYDNLMGATFQVNIGSTALSGTNYLLQTVIIEDSLYSGQLDNAVDSQFVTHFCHNHVLRGAIGNNTGGLVWGTAIPASVTGTANSSWTLFQTYDFTQGENGTASGWNMANCYIVAFVYNQATYQVVQAEMIKVE